MLFSTAFAQTAAGGGSDFQAQLVQFAPLIMIAGVFYFLLIRPQQQRAKQLKTAVAALRRGDKIVTAGGIIASITRVINEEEIEAEIAPGVKARVLRSTITTILSKTEPVKGGKSSEKDIPTQLIEGEINEIDSENDANMTADAKKKKRAPTKPSAAETKAAAAKAKQAEAAPVEVVPTPAPAPVEAAPVETKPTDSAN